MRIAVVGKGGSGKTTTASVVARALARRGESVVALDGDTNANLGISLGLGLEATEALVTMRERLDAGEEKHAGDIDLVLERFGSEAPDGVRLAVVTRIESPEPGCPCCGLSIEQVLTELEGTASTVVADLEAGLGTLSRLGRRGGIDTVLVVVEPTPKSLEVGVRAAALASDNGIGEVLVVANRVRDEQDVATVRDWFGGVEVFAVPDDPAVVRADREGVAPLDADPTAPAVRALEELAGRLCLASVG
jgi:CO dehydrogenase maturation factor